MTHQGLWWCVALALGGCAGAPPAPPLEAYRLGMYRADYRDYRKADICNAQPRWLLEELRSPLGVMGRFIKAASSEPDGQWSKEDLEIAEEGVRTLGPLLEVLRSNLRLVQRCSFSDQPGYVALLHEGPARCTEAERLQAYVPELMAYRKARRFQDQWKLDRMDRDSAARYLCAGPPSRTPLVYRWVVDCDGSQEWRFCDGARLVRDAGSTTPRWTPPIRVEAPPPPRRGRRRKAPPPPPGEEAYVAAAEAFKEVDRCPAVPAPPARP